MDHWCFFRSKVRTAKPAHPRVGKFVSSVFTTPSMYRLQVKVAGNSSHSWLPALRTFSLRCVDRHVPSKKSKSWMSPRRSSVYPGGVLRGGPPSGATGAAVAAWHESVVEAASAKSMWCLSMRETLRPHSCHLVSCMIAAAKKCARAASSPS